MWKTVVRWTILNLASEWVCTRLGPKRTMRLRYEDFVADPKAALERIGSLIELDLTDVADAASSGRTAAGWAQRRREQDKKVGDHNATTGLPRNGGRLSPLQSSDFHGC